MEANAKDLRWYREELDSNGCACDRQKKPGFSFCYRCNSELPSEMKKALYRKPGHGYEEAYEAACKWLEENVW